MVDSIISLEKRLKENVKNYKLEKLYNLEELYHYFRSLSKFTGIEFLLTSRHGEKTVCVGNFTGFNPDVVNDPGEKIKVNNRTIGHLYVKGNLNDDTKELIRCILEQLRIQAQSGYDYVETSIYVDELEKLLEKEKYQAKHGEKEDALTGVLNRTYFDNRMKIIDRSEVLPVSVICANINDWKFFDDNFGKEESNRLIQTIASFLIEESKEDYVIGRYYEDFFYILIPMADDGEAQEYLAAVKRRCEEFRDKNLVPSVACGIAVKTNVEEKLETLLEDAEYEMFDDKVKMKNSPGYIEMLESVLVKKI